MKARMDLHWTVCRARGKRAHEKHAKFACRERTGGAALFRRLKGAAKAGSHSDGSQIDVEVQQE